MLKCMEFDRPARLPLCVRCVDKNLFSFAFTSMSLSDFSFVSEILPFWSKCDATALLNGVYLDCEREFSNTLNGGFLEADLDGTTFAYDCRMRQSRTV